MDEGSMSFSSSAAGFVSNRQSGIFKTNASISIAWACPNCGFVEMYVDPEQLRRNIS
jgi:hypothetical protein